MGFAMTDAEDVRGLLAVHRPGYRIDSVVLLGAGTDNVAFEVNDELIVRFAARPDPVVVDREARLLSAVAALSPLPVPTPVFTVPEQGCVAYFKLPGVPLLDLPQLRSRTSIAAALGGLLAILHAVPVERLAGLVEPDVLPAAEWLSEAAESFAATAAEIPAPYHRSITDFLVGPPPDERFEPVFSHNDLGCEHVLVDPSTGAVTGIIDWSDAGLVDPAYDFGLIHRDLGPAALQVALSHYPANNLEPRATFYSRCTVFEDLAYGIETNDCRYVDKCVTSLEWLFESSA